MVGMKNTCHVCGASFEVRFRYQMREENGRYTYVCSQTCQQRLLEKPGGCTCSVCGKKFSFVYAYQAVTVEGARLYFCSPECRKKGVSRVQSHREPNSVRRIAVFNQKGGTGKTTTSVNLAAGLADLGHRVLLVDVDGQGNVGASLGVQGDKSLYHLVVLGTSVREAAVPVRNNLDVITANETVAAAELYLASRPNRERVLRERIGAESADYDVVVLDCAPALSLMNQNALVFADSVLVPVGCDYLSLVGVKQVLRTIQNVRKMLGYQLRLLGVLPTFYDIRNRIAREVLETLTHHFGDRCFEPIRVNTKIRESPSAKQTIFEYDCLSRGAEDYLSLVHTINRMRSGQVTEAVRSGTPGAAPRTESASARVDSASMYESGLSEADSSESGTLDARSLDGRSLDGRSPGVVGRATGSRTSLSYGAEPPSGSPMRTERYSALRRPSIETAPTADTAMLEATRRTRMPAPAEESWSQQSSKTWARQRSGVVGEPAPLHDGFRRAHPPISGR